MLIASRKLFDQKEKARRKFNHTLLKSGHDAITKHINNVFKEGELEREGNVQNLHIANSDKPVMFYDLDVIISVGYRVKSKRGVEFRRWATDKLIAATLHAALARKAEEEQVSLNHVVNEALAAYV